MDILLVNIHTVADLQAKLGILERWTEQQREYQEMLAYMKTNKFWCAVDKLQKLVMQWLFELSKANMAGTGYKLRQKISKAIKTRGKAVRSALDNYNDLAARMTPPAPHLKWGNILDYAFISDFELLKHAYSQQDITREPWTIPGNREIMTKYFKVKCAREELERLNVEIRHLRAFIVDEHGLMHAQLHHLRGSDPYLVAELKAVCHRRHQVDALHLLRLDDIESLPGFTGTHTLRGETNIVLVPQELDSTEGMEDLIEDDAVQDEMICLGEFFENLSVE
ncbi:uncharacterized protein EDB91DRAFT_1062539 [Suillus paluster]|uniref:uncharacterized protein n=1 Tax=Suillus paluster TaxID=48578 RepID=UPI001B87CE19|nr:uncharacterized protein EDB91DRAFT_1062539 [Suillus paluster]KAG1724941.1 hypothetical protein EDB91DRAFT_1062539 [Suillus paluster]